MINTMPLGNTLPVKNTGPLKITHHPSTDMLVEYANGTLPWALSIGVAAHIQLCSECRQQVETLNKIGSAELQKAEAAKLSDSSFEQLMARVQRVADSSVRQPDDEQVESQDKNIQGVELPKAVKKLANHKLSWRRISSALKTARLTAGQSEYEVAFHSICRGGRVVEHDHAGLEVTLVLDGSFSDDGGIYHRGDFLIKQPGEVHRPTATQNHDCLCLSICEAPVKVTGIFGWFINPFLKISPA